MVSIVNGSESEAAELAELAALAELMDQHICEAVRLREV
jgi:hypothetical protein